MNNLTSYYGNLKNSNTVGKFKNLTKSPLIVKGVIFVVIVVAVIIVMVLIDKLIFHTMSAKHDSPWLIKGSKNAKNSHVIPQDPKNENAVTLYRSDGEDGGMQFTYTFWFVIENMEHRYGKWKHIFHKGNKTSFPNRAPGVFIDPAKNSIRIYMNTFKDPNEHVDIENIPVKRWVHMAVILENKYLDIYVNGFLRKRHELSSVAKQNFGDVWVNMYGGFEGYLSKLRYYRRALKYNEIESIVKEGPSKESCSGTGEIPPYLDNEWWFDLPNDNN